MGIVVLKNEQPIPTKKIGQIECSATDIIEKAIYNYSPTLDGLLIWRVNENEEIEIVNLFKGQLFIDFIYVEDDEQSALAVGNGQIMFLNISSKKYILVDFVFGIYSYRSICLQYFQQKFVIVCNSSQEFFLYDIQDRSNPKQILIQILDNEMPVNIILKPIGTTKVYGFLSTKYYGVKVFDFSFIYTMKPSDIINVSKFRIGWINISIGINKLALSPDLNQLYISARSYGIFCYDISDEAKISNPVYTQTITSSGLALDIRFKDILKEDNTLLSREIQYSNGSDFKIFKSIEIKNSQQDDKIINTFNAPIQCEEYSIFQDIWAWQLQITSDNKYFTLSAGADGMFLFDIQADYMNPQLKFRFKNNDGQSYDGSLFLEKRKLLISGHSQTGFSIIDLSDPNNIRKVVQFQFPFLSDADGFDSDKNTETKLLIALGPAGVGIVDIEDIYNIKILSVVQPKRRGSLENVGSNRQFTYGYGAVREIGVFLYRINPTTYELTEIDTILTYGTEFLAVDFLNQNYIYVADGYNGLTILDTSDPENTYKLSNIKVSGWGEKLYQSRLNPNLILISHSVIGSISVIDVTNKSQPFVQSTISFDNDSSYSVVTDSNHNFVIFTKRNGFRVCNMKQQVQVIVEAKKGVRIKQALSKIIDPQQSYVENTYKFETFNNNIEPVFPNQSISFSVILLTTIKTAKIGNSYYFSQGRKFSLPDWIIFRPASSTYQLIIPPSTLEANPAGVNIILSQILVQILQSDFINPYLNLGKEESQQIYKYLVNSTKTINF